MSNISTIYDTLRTEIPTLSGFTTKTEIPLPDSLTSNIDNVMRDGWGIIVGGASPSGFIEFNSQFTDQEFTIVLTREIFRQTTSVEPGVTTNKAMLEDVNTLKARFLQSDELGIHSNIAKIEFASSTGIEFVETGKNNLRSMSVTFIFTIREQINFC